MRILLAALATFLLLSCGPIYETQYRYTPPADAQGRACIAQCEVGKSQCRINADLRAENRQLRCEREARDDFERCLTVQGADPEKSHCQRRICSLSSSGSDQDQCESDHRVCFQGCGGVVSSQQVCSFNCPPAP